MTAATEVIKKLGLEPLPGEGGYYKETYKSSVSASAKLFGVDGNGDRTLSTAIFYLVVPNSFSALHRLKSDEIFHFYSGDPVEMIQIAPDGKLNRYVLGSNIMAGQQPQVVVAAGTWQGTRLKKGGAWALMGTTVAPGFEFEDLEMADRELIQQAYPQYAEDIMLYTRGRNESAH